MAMCHNLAAPETTIDVIGKAVGLVVVVAIVSVEICDPVEST
jgi:hypothetical protein